MQSVVNSSEVPESREGHKQVTEEAYDAKARVAERGVSVEGEQRRWFVEKREPKGWSNLATPSLPCLDMGTVMTGVRIREQRHLVLLAEEAISKGRRTRQHHQQRSKVDDKLKVKAPTLKAVGVACVLELYSEVRRFHWRHVQERGTRDIGMLRGKEARNRACIQPTEFESLLCATEAETRRMPDSSRLQSHRGLCWKACQRLR